MFLSCTPSVFAVRKDYQILVNTNENGLIHIEVGGRKYYEKNSGVLSTEKNYNIIALPQKVLDRTKEYTIVYRRAIDRKAYFSVIDKEQRATFSFKPLQKTNHINIYHIADVHYHYAVAEQTAAYFGDDLDLLIVNGDIGEVETHWNYFETAQFVGNISKGSIPVIFTRGNHDTRGKLAELFDTYFPSDDKKTYYTFGVGCISGIVFDCGEDKKDDYVYGAEYNFMRAYDGYNIFGDYRKRQTKYFNGLKKIGGKYKFCIGHICPNQTSVVAHSDTDIERAAYSGWTKNFERLGIQMMFCGHIHKAYFLSANDQRNIINHKYPVIVGSACNYESGLEDIIGTAVTLEGGTAICRFTNKDRTISEKFELSLF